MHERVEKAVKAIKAVFKHHPSGGYLHSVISDGNVHGFYDEVPEVNPWTEERFSAQERRRYQRCVKALEALSLDAQEYAIAVANGYADEWIDEHCRMTGDDADEIAALC